MDKNGTPTPDPKKTVPLLPEEKTPTAVLTSNLSHINPTNTQEPPIDAESTIKVFISYAHEDQELHKKLVKHLMPLEHTGKIRIWHDQEIPAGANWKDQIDDHLNEAGMILLLVSCDFIASEYCWNKEVLAALERHKDGKVQVLPIILKPVDWQDTPLGQLQALPIGAQPVTQWNDQDAAFDNVAQGIRRVVDHLRGETHGKEKMRELWNNLISNMKKMVSINDQKKRSLSPRLLLISAILLIGYLLSVGLYFLINDMSLLTWFIVPLIVILLSILLIRIESINTRIPVKTGERRVLLSAVPIGFLAILGSSLLRETNLRTELENGSLTQLRMGLLPNDIPHMAPFENSLSDLLGIPVSSYRWDTYEETINALAKGDVEVAWLGAVSYLRAHQKYGVRIILCKLAFDQKKTYQCYIITYPEANIHVVGDLKGKRFALTDPSGTSGRLIPLYQLKKAGLDPNKDIETFYAGSHPEVLEQVHSGLAPAGAVSSDVYHRALRDGKFQQGDLNILDVGENIDIPVGPIVVRKDIQHYDELRIEDAFLTAAEDLSVIHTMDIGGIAKAVHESYEFLLPIAKGLDIKIEELD